MEDLPPTATSSTTLPGPGRPARKGGPAQRHAAHDDGMRRAARASSANRASFVSFVPTLGPTGP